ncbi:MAG: hypothetical protein DRJ66_01130 [Thermoprotei archaeon]|nr:MAG: hypothetical protein DRJ66_01130 [Thermoprotei archaeon]
MFTKLNRLLILLFPILLMSIPVFMPVISSNNAITIIVCPNSAIEIRAEDEVNITVPLEINISLVLDSRDEETVFSCNGYVRNNETTQAGLILMELSINSSLISSSDEITSSITMLLIMKSKDQTLKQLRILGDNITIKARKSPSEVVCKGKMELSGEGEIIPFIALGLTFLQKDVVEELLRRQNITWIELKELSLSMRDSIIEISFMARIDINDLVKYIASMNSDMTVDKLLSNYFSSFIEGRSKMRAIIISTENEIAFNISGRISRSLFKSLVNITDITSGLSAMGSVSGVLHPNGIWDFAGRVIEDFLERFEVLPSRINMNLSLRDNLLKYSIKGLRIRARSAISHKDTFVAVDNFLKDIGHLAGQYGLYEISSYVDKLMKTEVKLAPLTKDMTISRTSAKFMELPEIEVSYKAKGMKTLNYILISIAITTVISVIIFLLRRTRI